MRSPLRVAALAAVCTAAMSCGGGGSTTPSSPTSLTTNPSTGTSTTSNAMTITITRQNGAQSFSPSPADAGGQVVVFHNADTIVHRVILNDGSIDTGNIAPNATSMAFLMPEAGTNYHCSLHPDMIGAVNSSNGGSPPACMGIYCS